MPAEKSFLEEAIATSKDAFKYVFLFSMGTNLLMLALPIYTLQVLDRVVTSNSMETLVMLTLIVFCLFVALGLFYAVRTFTLIKLGEWFDAKVARNLLAASISTSAVLPGISGSQNLRDMTAIKTFLTGAGLMALFDAPWSLVFLLVLFVVHPLLGIITFMGGLLLLFLAILNEKAVNAILSEANESNVRSMNQAEISSRNADVIEAMGMMGNVINQWQKLNGDVLTSQTLASNRSNVIASIAKVIRMTLQIIIVGTGAYLVLNSDLTVGAIIAGSILAGRVLAPFEAAIGAWTSIANTRKSYDRLKKAIAAAPRRRQSMKLPTPVGHISVEKVLYAAPGTNKPIIKGISFSLNPGESLGIIGPSAAGKSTLAKLLVGIWPPNNGVVRLDGADVYTWNREDFGQYVGYMPQDVELFGGTVRDNIARLQTDVSDEDVIAAAKISGAHDMILRLPDGYETEIGPGGANLSAGQRQRIGLARAFYGNPKLLVLDEPNSNLDDVGEGALVAALKNAKSLRMTSVVIAHRPSVLTVVDKLLVLREGMVADFGPAAEIISKYGKSQRNAQLGAQGTQQAKGKITSVDNDTGEQVDPKQGDGTV